MDAAPPTDRASPRTHRRIRPTGGWRALDPAELWRFRGLLWTMTERDIRVRYKQTLLGIAWALLQPLVAMVVFTVVFGRLAKLPSEGVSYEVFVYAGLLPWQVYSLSLTRSANSLLAAQDIISKVYFPRLLLPLSSVGIALVEFAIASGLLFVLMLVYSVPLSATVLLAPVFVIGASLSAVAVGSILAGVSARYRDVQHLIPFGVQILLYASPVVYSPDLIPERWRLLAFLNPAAGFIDATRAAFLGRAIDWTALGVSVGMSLVAALLAAVIFARVDRKLADIL